MKRIVYSVIFAALFVASCGNGGKNGAEGGGGEENYRKVIEMKAYAEGEAPHDSITLGRLKQGETVECRLGLRNADTANMVILEVIQGCGCTALEYDKQPVRPGDTASVTLRYDSKGQFGGQIKVIQVLTTLDKRPHYIYVYADVKRDGEI